MVGPVYNVEAEMSCRLPAVRRATARAGDGREGEGILEFRLPDRFNSAYNIPRTGNGGHLAERCFRVR